MELKPDEKTTAASDWRLTACCRSGLSNRLKVMISGMALAEATGRSFKMMWPLNAGCAAPFGSLFENDWNVVDVPLKERAKLPPKSDWRHERLPDLLVARDRHLTANHSSWLIKPSAYPAHEPLFERCLELFHQLQPTAYVRDRVSCFQRDRFRPQMIGVHLRRGDFLRTRPDATANTSQAIAEVDAFLTQRPDAGIFLCTDDGAVDAVTKEVHHEGVHQQFQDRFGERVVFTRPRSLDRESPEAIQDALVDLLLLRQTQMFVATRGSTFSELVVFDRDIPSVKCAGALPNYSRFERWAKITGFYYALIFAGYCYYGRRVPFAALWRLWIVPCLPARYQRPWTRL